ncbi:hypothetical protein [Candidatus Spongiihabitans sp.]|uniref:hypothetical protein n=1 Tax=Candidatus Spongiihabitans sp. TaxID=3101308 RepID=UPI003C7D0869
MFKFIPELTASDPDVMNRQRGGLVIHRPTATGCDTFRFSSASGGHRVAVI